MNDDDFSKLPISERLEHLLMASKDLAAGCARRDISASALSDEDAITNPLWSEIRDEQQRVLSILPEHSTRIDWIEAHLQQQDEKREDGFRRLNDKFQIATEEIFEIRAELKHLKRRVTRLEPVN